jgi:hypothetical protein
MARLRPTMSKRGTFLRSRTHLGWRLLKRSVNAEAVIVDIPTKAAMYGWPSGKREV